MNTTSKVKEYSLLFLGISLVAVGVYFFKFPNHFSMGGVSGLAVLLGKVVHVSWLTPSMFNTIINTAFLILGFIFLNRGFGVKTVVCSIVYTGLIQLFEWVCPLAGPMTSNKMLEAFFAILLPALGSGILFNLNASSGGTDIVAMILKKYSGLDVGRALLISDFLIAGSAFFVFDVETGLFSILGLLLKSVLVDSVIESMNLCKSFSVVTTNPEGVCTYITHELHRSATVWEGSGAYTHEPRWVVLTVLSRGQAVLLRRYLKENDPSAFMLISNSSEIFGKGFLRA